MNSIKLSATKCNGKSKKGIESEDEGKGEAKKRDDKNENCLTNYIFSYYCFF